MEAAAYVSLFVSAFAAGPAVLILVFTLIDRYGDLEVKKSIFDLLRRIASIALPLNYFLLGCEVFKEFYTDTAHVASISYLFFGIDGHGMLVPYIWTGLSMGLVAMVIFGVPRLYKQPKVLLAGCVMAVVGLWIEKGMGLVIPGFIPTPSGDLVEYTPSVVEACVSLGIWAFGAFLFTAMAKVAIAIHQGKLHAPAVAATPPIAEAAKPGTQFAD